MNTDLTRRQAEALDYIERQDVVPTLRELGKVMGIRSTNGVSDHLCMLEKKGRIARGDMKSRAIRVLVPLSFEERQGYGLAQLVRCASCGHVVHDLADLPAPVSATTATLEARIAG